MLVGLQYVHAVWRARRQPQSTLLEPTRTRLRAWPWLCDALGHINNARYFDVAAIGRVSWLASNRLELPLLRGGYDLIVAGSAVTYRREVKLMTPFTLETQLAAYDERWLHFSQTLVQTSTEGKERVAARIFVRTQLRQYREARDFRAFLNEMQISAPPSPPLPIDVAMQLKAQAATMDHIRGREERGEHASTDHAGYRR